MHYLLWGYWLPVTWDEVELLSGTPGKDIVIARRKGTNWYIGGLNGENVEKDIAVDLSFLDGSYELLKMVDGESSRLIVSEKSKFEGNLNIHILPHGGFTLKLTKV
ncbi:MAG: glycoside hydrolase family 97 C-terminal domain-containing protein [Cyclobacteriaceae bacterium]